MTWLNLRRTSRIVILLLTGLAWPLVSQAWTETKPSIPEASTIPSITAWFIGDVNYPPSGNPALFDGYPSAMDACTVAAKTYMDMLLHVPHLFPYQMNLTTINDSYNGDTADYLYRCMVLFAGNPYKPGEINYAMASQKCPAGYTLNVTNSPNKNPYVGPSHTTTTLQCDSPTRCPAVPEGEPKFILDAGGETCSREVTETYTLELYPKEATIEPGKQFLFTAMVLDQNLKPPSQSVPVSIEVEVDLKSGGHDHGDSSRPKGSVSPASGSNVFGIEFKSTDVSGTHTITATCDQCVNKTATAVVTVKVDGLEQIPDSEFYSFIGKKDFHANNHFLKPAASERLLVIAINYQSQDRFKVLDWRTNAMVYPPILHVNDASLKWGGRFDIKADWTNPHITHMRGIEVDIRANEENGAIPPENFEEFDKLLEQSITSKNAKRKKFLRECSANALSTSENPNPIQHNRKSKNYCVSEVDGSFDNNRHYHVRLLGD